MSVSHEPGCDSHWGGRCSCSPESGVGDWSTPPVEFDDSLAHPITIPVVTARPLKPSVKRPLKNSDVAPKKN
jgi:hypothetical protein